LKTVKFLIVLLITLIILPGIAIPDNATMVAHNNCITNNNNTISGMKFLDDNGNGKQDCWEQGIPGVTIKLYDSKNKLIAQTKTDRKGSYAFNRLGTGVYTVTEVVPAGYVSTTPTSKTVIISSKTKKVTVNFGNAKPATVKGLKYNDLNNNGKYNKGEPVLPGWTILLNNSSGNVRTAVTDSNGKFQFTCLLPGTYTISEVLKSGYTNTSALSRKITVTSGDVLNVTSKYGLFGNNVSAVPTKYAYVVNDGSNNVTAFDISTNAITADIPVGNSPWRVAFIPNGTIAYVTNQNDNDVSVIDTATNIQINTIPVGIFPTGVAFTPDGKLAFVTNSGETNVSVIDTASSSVIQTIPTGFEPFDVAVAPNGTVAYVTCQDGTITVIDVATIAVTNPITVCGQRQAMTVTATQEKAVSEISKVDPITLDAGLAGIAITPDSNVAIVTNEFTNNVTFINLITGEVITNVTVGSFPTTVRITPNGQKAYVSNAFSDDVSVLDVPDETLLVPSIPVGGIAASLGITPDGSKVYVSINELGIVVTIDTATDTVTGSPIPVGLNPQGVAVNPDP
jgi:YVTN family beta-propeller protein